MKIDFSKYIKKKLMDIYMVYCICRVSPLFACLKLLQFVLSSSFFLPFLGPSLICEVMV